MGATGRGFAAAAVAGAGSALITRALMRAVVLLTNGDPEFSLGALLFIALFYMLALLPGCLALARTRAWWAWLLLAAGVMLLAFEAVAIGLDETTATHDMTPGRWSLFVAVLVSMLATYAIQVTLAVHWARHGFHLQRHLAR